jgi:signal transduction histidine kinase
MSLVDGAAERQRVTRPVWAAWLSGLPIVGLPERVSTDDEAAYRETSRASNLRNGKLFILGLTAALLLWWPTDWLVFHGQERVLSVFSAYRPVLIVFGLAVYLILRFVPFSRRSPEVVLALGGIGLSGITAYGFSGLVGPSGPFFHMLYFAMLGPVAFAAPFRWRVVVTGALGLTIVATYFGAHPEHWSDPFALTSVNQFFFSVVLSIATGAVSERLWRSNFFLRRELSRQAEKLEVRVQEQTAELRALAAYNESTRESERTHIARELHDELGQELTALRYALSLTSVRYQRDQASIASNLRELDDLINRTALTAKNIVLDLRPRVLDDLGLFAAADWLVRRTQERTGIQCELDSHPCELPEPIAIAAYRILQESLTNVSRHAQASSVRVTVRCEDDRLSLAVRDDGVGLDASRGTRSGMGLIGMRERARALGGELRVSSPANGGALVEAWLPLAGPTQESA